MGRDYSMNTFTQHPCKQDCPRRKGGCAAKCPEWLAYEKKKLEEYERRAAAARASESTAGTDRALRKADRLKRTNRRHQ